MVVFVTLLVPMLWINRSTFSYLAQKWDLATAGTYSHGYLVVLISLYILYESRRRLAHARPGILPGAVAPLLLVLLINVLSVLADVQIVQASSLLLMLLALVWFVFGTAVARQLWFPILYIGFAIPIWYPLSPYLQQITADASFYVIRLLEIPAYIDGNVIALPSGRLSVEQSCAGLNYLLAAMTLGTLYAWLNYTGVKARALVVLVAVCTAVLSNILRVIIIIYLAYITEMQHPLVKDHLSLGWALFAAFFGMLLVFDYLMHQRRTAQPATEITKTVAEQPVFISGGQLLLVVLVMVVSVVLAESVSQSAAEPPGEADSQQVVALPDRLGGWVRVDRRDSWHPVYHGASESVAVYEKADGRITLYIGYYSVQQQGRELINALNRIDNPAVWRKKHTQAIDYAINSAPLLEQVLVDAKDQERVVWYWYRIAGVRTTNALFGKLLQAVGQLRGERGSAVIAMAAWPQTARVALEDFFMQLQSSQEAWLR